MVIAGTEWNVASPERTGLVSSEDQARLWRLWKLFPGDRTALHVGAAAHFRGALDLGAFATALGQVVAHHSALRTSFADLPNHAPIRSIAPAWNVPVIPPLVDAGRDALGSDGVVQRHLHAVLEEPLPLDAAPLWKTRLLRFDDRHHALVFVCHHIVADYSSVALFFNELRWRYECARDPSWRSADPVNPRRDDDVDEMAFQELLRAEVMSKRAEGEAWWRAQLTGVRPLSFADARRGRGLAGGYAAESLFSQLGDDLTKAIDRRAAEAGIRPAAFHLTAFAASVVPFSGRAPFVIGVPVDLRQRKRDRGAIGFFSSPRLVRTDPAAGGSPEERVRRMDLALTGMLRRRALPFSQLTTLLETESGSSGTALPALFNYVAREQPGDEGYSVRFARASCGPCRTSTPLWLTVDRAGPNGLVQLDFATELFEGGRARALFDRYQTELQALVAPRRTLASAAPATEWPSTTVRLCASFTADPLTPMIDAWGRFLGIRLAAESLPPNQVMQQLLNPSADLAQNRSGVNVVLVRVRDLVRPRDHESGAAQQLCAAVRDLLTRTSVPLIFGVCPGADPAAVHDIALEAELAEQLGAMPGVQFVGAAEWTVRYTVSAVHDPHAERVAGVPYARPYLTALATEIVRRVTRLQRRATKVVVLDGDETLWDGILGEDGVDGVRLGPGRLALHDRLIRCAEAGVLLCLCSKNDPDLVRAFFDKRTDSRLRRSHIHAEKIGWGPKAESVDELSRELNVGLDTFLFLDDSPVEIEEMRARLPEVLSVRIPSADDAIARFVDHIWSLDTGPITPDDRRRGQSYKEQRVRQVLRSTMSSYLDFLEHLRLEVDLRRAGEGDLSRAAQLTMRTTQFNINGDVLRESVLRSIDVLSGDGKEVWVVLARDRFGDYGTVGLFVTEAEPGRAAMRVSTFLLSCRALGRGIEHRMLAAVGAMACSRGLTQVDMVVRPTQRNSPVRTFLLESGAVPQPEGLWRLPAAAARDARIAEPRSDGAAIAPPDPARIELPSRIEESELMARIAADLTSTAAIDRTVMGREPRDVDESAVRRLDAEAIAKIFARLLRRPIGIDDDFFAGGGSSLDAVEALSCINSELHHAFDLDAFYEARSSRALAASALSATGAHAPSSPSISSAHSPLAAMIADAELPLDVVPAHVGPPACRAPALGAERIAVAQPATAEQHVGRQHRQLGLDPLGRLVGAHAVGQRGGAVGRDQEDARGFGALGGVSVSVRLDQVDDVVRGPPRGRRPAPGG